MCCFSDALKKCHFALNYISGHKTEQRSMFYVLHFPVVWLSNQSQILHLHHKCNMQMTKWTELSQNPSLEVQWDAAW